MTSRLVGRRVLGAAAIATLAPAALAQAGLYRVVVTAENLAPNGGTFQTPVWVGFHDGTFDSYDGGTLADSLPIPGSGAIESLAEDGDTTLISADFDTLAVGAAQATLPGPAGPIAPGDTARGEFLLDPLDVRARYFSYASMVIPSNDAFVANGSGTAHPIFDDQGLFVASSFFVQGSAVNDAGTEVNDELPANTAFLAQAAPNTGVTEGGLIADHVGFLPAGSGGILDNFLFANGSFLDPGYSMLRFDFRAAPAITEDRLYAALPDGTQEVPSVNTPAFGAARFKLRDQGTRVDFLVTAIGLQNLTAGHLHIAPAGSNGPVAVDLLALGSIQTQGRTTMITGSFDGTALGGPVTGFPLDELIGRMDAGDVYINLHTDDGVEPANTGPGDFASGEIRGQLFRAR